MPTAHPPPCWACRGLGFSITYSHLESLHRKRVCTICKGSGVDYAGFIAGLGIKPPAEPDAEPDAD